MRSVRRWRPYPVDETCKFYLPMYKHGGEVGSVMPDLSTSHNDGTIVGAVPNPGSPMIATPELMPNQVDRDFSGASAWANVDLNAYNETTDLTITANAAAQYCTCPVASMPTTIGEKYRLYYDLANIVESWTVKGFDGTQTIGTISSNATQGYFDFVASTTGGLRLVAVANTSSGDFDNFSLKEITGYTGLGEYLDGADDYVNCGTGLASINYPITFCVWINLVTLYQDAIIMSLNVTDPNTDIAFGVYMTGDIILLGRSTYTYGLSGISTYLTANKWQCWSLVFTDTTHITFFLDGVQKTLSDVGNWYGVSSAGLFIGTDAVGSLYFLNGSVGEGLIFNRALSVDEIRAFFELTRSKYGV